jgi:hypothetical protein
MARATRGSSPTTSHYSQPRDQRHRRHGAHRRSATRAGDPVRTAGLRSRHHRRAGQRRRHRARRSGPAVQPLLQHQARGHGHRTIDQPLDRRGAWRPAVGDAERAARRVLLHLSTGRHAGAGGRLAEVVDVAIDGTRLISDQGTHIEDPLRQFDSPSGSRPPANQPSKPMARPRVAAALARQRDPDALGVPADPVDRGQPLRLTHR